MTQTLTPQARRAQGSICLDCMQMVDSLDRCGCVKPRPAQGYDLTLFPWEDAALVIAEAEAVFEEMESKPGLGIEPGYDPSLDFEALLAEVQTTGGWVTASPAHLASFDAESIGEHFVRHPWLY